MGGGSKVLSEYFLNYQLKMSIPKGSFWFAKLGPLHYMAVLTSSHSPTCLPERRLFVLLGPFYFGPKQISRPSLNSYSSTVTL